MAIHFPSMYWDLVVLVTKLNLSALFLMLILFRNYNFYHNIIIFASFEILSMIEYKLLFEKIIERKFKARLRKGSRIEYIYYTDFFDTYLIWQAEDVWYKINYYDISKAIETDTNFYLVYGGMLLVFQKNSCGLNLINFLKTKFNNTENYVRS